MGGQPTSCCMSAVTASRRKAHRERIKGGDFSGALFALLYKNRTC